MSSPDSAFCHHHSVTPAQKTITLSSQEAPICSAQQDMSRGFVFLFRKKPNQIKTLRQIKDPEKNPNNNKECVLDCSYFLPSLSRKLVFLPFFSQSNSNNWKPFQNLQRQPQPLQPPDSPGAPDALCCRSNSSPGKQKILQKENRKFTPESLHCLLPFSAHQPHPCRSAATQGAINYRYP